MNLFLHLAKYYYAHGLICEILFDTKIVSNIIIQIYDVYICACLSQYSLEYLANTSVLFALRNYGLYVEKVNRYVKSRFAVDFYRRFDDIGSESIQEGSMYILCILSSPICRLCSHLNNPDFMKL